MNTFWKETQRKVMKKTKRLEHCMIDHIIRKNGVNI